MIPSQWQNKKVAFLGDSITDRIHVGTEKNYWQFLEEELGILPLVYGVNGKTWNHIPEQTGNLLSDHSNEVDAIFIFAGTNDYMSNTPPGEWFTCCIKKTVHNGNEVKRSWRSMNYDPETFTGRINNAMKLLKENFPQQQIVLLTPLHRAFAEFSPTNIQPDENYANSLGLFFDSYVAKIREAADIWSCPLIDLYSESGLYPLADSHGQFFHHPQTDLLHPNAAGHKRIARTMLFKMLSIPSNFK